MEYVRDYLLVVVAFAVGMLIGWAMVLLLLHLLG
jgi:hypothetical protein